MTYKEYCKENFGYDTITTYWDDFTIADKFGISAVKDAYERAMLNKDYKIMTELSMVLNHKIWAHYEKNEPLAKVYNDLWGKCCDWCTQNLKGEELSYYFRTTD